MYEIKHTDQMFYIEDDEGKRLAKITFFHEGEHTIVIDHTIVSDALKGQGIAIKLVNSVVEFARRKELKIRPECTYAKKILTSDASYADVLAE